MQNMKFVMQNIKTIAKNMKVIMQNIKAVAKNVASNPNLWEPLQDQYKRDNTKETIQKRL